MSVHLLRRSCAYGKYRQTDEQGDFYIICTPENFVETGIINTSIHTALAAVNASGSEALGIPRSAQWEVPGMNTEYSCCAEWSTSILSQCHGSMEPIKTEVVCKYNNKSSKTVVE